MELFAACACAVAPKHSEQLCGCRTALCTELSCRSSFSSRAGCLGWQCSVVVEVVGVGRAGPVEMDAISVVLQRSLTAGQYLN